MPEVGDEGGIGIDRDAGRVAERRELGVDQQPTGAVEEDVEACTTECRTCQVGGEPSDRDLEMEDAGMLTGILATLRFLQTGRDIESGVVRFSPVLDIALAVLFSIAGAVLAVYLIATS
jgi:hypothetical protein